MKQILKALTLIALLSLFSGCTVLGSGENLGKKHVTIRTGSPLKARELSATQDIDFITYEYINLNDATDNYMDYVDPNYPYIDLYLYPDANYRIIIDVAITSTAPGYNVGVIRYGDQADFYVDPYYDTYVDLNIHPTQTLVFKHQVSVSTVNTVNAYDPSAPLTPWSQSISGPALTVHPADKFFYSGDGKLFYFNKTENKIYWWKDITQPLDPNNDLLVDGTDPNKNIEMEIYAVASDPNSLDALVAVGHDMTAVDKTSGWYFFTIDTSGGASNITTVKSNDITTDLENGVLGADIVPTSIAADTLGDVYLGFYNTLAGEIQSGVLAYYDGNLFAATPSDMTFYDQSSSIVTDLCFTQGKLLVLASPNTSLGSVGYQNSGTADLWILDDYLNPLAAIPSTVAQVYSTAPTFGNKLYLPQKFSGLPQGSTIYFQQGDFAASGGTYRISSLNLDLDTWSVSDH